MGHFREGQPGAPPQAFFHQKLDAPEGSGEAPLASNEVVSLVRSPVQAHLHEKLLPVQGGQGFDLVFRKEGPVGLQAHLVQPRVAAAKFQHGQPPGMQKGLPARDGDASRALPGEFVHQPAENVFGKEEGLRAGAAIRPAVATPEVAPARDGENHAPGRSRRRLLFVWIHG